MVEALLQPHKSMVYTQERARNSPSAKSLFNELQKVITNGAIARSYPTNDLDIDT